ncbi:MAG: ABC transporter substrate-binding protein [Pseudomonadota bacterium]
MANLRKLGSLNTAQQEVAHKNERLRKWALENNTMGRGPSRRDFIKAGTAFGLSVAMTSALWTEVKAATPRKGGKLQAAADGGASTDTFNPLQASGVDHTTLSVLSCFDTLTEIDSKGAPQPSLAESWEGAADGTWVFKLREGVEFHDGKSLTAEDVVWSLKQHLSQENKFAEGKQIIENLEELRADGSNQVIMKQREVNFDLPAHLSSFGLIIGQEGTTDWNAGIGTGPYTKIAFEPGQRFQGAKFANFYRDDQGHFDEVELLNVTDATARASGLMSGSLEVIGQPDVNTAKRLGGIDGFTLLEVPGTQHYTTDMRTDTDPFTDNHIRSAVKWGIKRQEIVDKVLGGFGTIGNDVPISRGQQFFNSDLPQREYDPDKAKFHLKQAGLDSIDLTFSTSDGAFPGAVNAGILMQESMRPAGINVNLDRAPADGYWSDVWLKAPWCAVYWNGRPTVDWMLTSTYISSSPWNSTYFKNPTFDQLLVDARGEADEAKRRDMYFEAQRLLYEEGGVTVLGFANILIAKSDKLGHGEIGVSRRMDDSRLPRRWWFEA